MTTATPKLVELAGDALLDGPNMMREPHWDWRHNAPCASYLIRTQDGEAAAILRLFLRLLRCPEDLVGHARVFRAVGIGGVWTRPDLRQQGYASELLAGLIRKLRAQQPSADIIILYSKPRTLYTRLAFREIANGLLAHVLHDDVVLREAEWYVDPEGHF